MHRGDTLSAMAAIAAPLRILGQQPIRNAAPTQTMFIIVIDPFCGNWTLRLRNNHSIVAFAHEGAENCTCAGVWTFRTINYSYHGVTD